MLQIEVNEANCKIKSSGTPAMLYAEAANGFASLLSHLAMKNNIDVMQVSVIMGRLIPEALKQLEVVKSDNN